MVVKMEQEELARVEVSAFRQVEVESRNASGEWELVSSGGSKGGREGRAPPPLPKISSFSCSFREKLAK